MELCYKNNPKSLFRKYAKLVTWFSNTKLGKEYLQYNNLHIPNEKITLLLPNGYHVIKEFYKNGNPKTIQATFTTRACYSPKLYKALWSLDRVSQWIEDFEEAKQVLLGQLGLIPWGNMPVAVKMLRFTTTTFNPDANVESTSVDGVLRNDPADTTFSSLRNGTGTGADDSSIADNCPFLVDGAGSPNFTLLYYGAFLFDTSSIPDSNIISSATFKIFTGGTSTNNVSQSMSMGTVNPASNTALVASDFQTVGYVRQADDVAFPAANSSFIHTLNSTGLGNISKTGISKFSSMISGQMDNSAPTYGSGTAVQLTTMFADNGSNKPELTVTYDVVQGDGSYAFLM